jgi:CheY-like chemotaxis protein
MLQLTGQAQEENLCVSLRVKPPEASRPAGSIQVRERISALEELAAISRAEISAVRAGPSVVGFDVRLPVSSQPTVLVVDDNEDVLQLFQRYLGPYHYRVVTAQTAQEALDKAKRLQPHAITLDLMLPGQDGWSLLSTLLNQPGTRQIPIIVCSVLRQRDLALMLGATAFLEKPITEQALVSTLKALEKA